MPSLGMGASPSSRVHWGAVAVYYGLACAISWPFFGWRDLFPEEWRSWGAPGILKNASYMWGPGLAAVATLIVFRRRHQRTVTFFGGAPLWALSFYLVPLFVRAAVGGDPYEGMSGSVWPLAAALFAMATILGEELGWRGFLQDALRPLTPWKRYVLIGLLWEAWHFTNRIHGRSAKQIVITLAISYPVVILLSVVIGWAVERSRSVLVATGLHLWVDLCFEPPSWTTAAVLGASLPFWFVMLRRWPAQRTERVFAEASLPG